MSIRHLPLHNLWASSSRKAVDIYTLRLSRHVSGGLSWFGLEKVLSCLKITSLRDV